MLTPQLEEILSKIFPVLAIGDACDKKESEYAVNWFEKLIKEEFTKKYQLKRLRTRADSD